MENQQLPHDQIEMIVGKIKAVGEGFVEVLLPTAITQFVSTDEQFKVGEEVVVCINLIDKHIEQIIRMPEEEVPPKEDIDIDDQDMSDVLIG